MSASRFLQSRFIYTGLHCSLNMKKNMKKKTKRFKLRHSENSEGDQRGGFEEGGNKEISGGYRQREEMRIYWSCS